MAFTTRIPRGSASCGAGVWVYLATEKDGQEYMIFPRFGGHFESVLRVPECCTDCIYKVGVFRDE